MAKTARKKTAAADVTDTNVGDNNHVVDIPHEEVHESSDQKTSGTLVTVFSIDQQIRNELAKFNLADAAIAQLKEQYGGLVITGQDDKTGYKSVKEAWNMIRSKRTAIEKKGLELRKDYQVITKAISGEEDRLIDLLKPLEDDLHKKWKAIDDEKDRLKREQEEAEQKQLMARVEEIQTLGMTFSNGFYQIGETISVDVASLRMFNPEQYEKLKGAIVAKKKELDKIEADAAEKKRLEDEQRQKDQDELKRQQDLLKQQQDDLRKQQEDLENQKREAARQRTEMRTNKLLALGMTYAQRADLFEFDNGFKSVTHAGATLFELDDYGFEEHLKVIAGLIKESKDGKERLDQEKKKEQEEKDRREKFIADALVAIGMNWNFSRSRFEWTSTEVEPIIVTWNDFAGMDDAAIATKAHELGDQITKAKQEESKILAERKADQEKQERLGMDDKTRYAREHALIAGAATKMVPGEFKTKKYQQRAQQFLERLTNLLNEFE
jgi:hypothetical protein